MTPKERAAMQQALEALESCNVGNWSMAFDEFAVVEAITTLREALAEQAEQEPMAIGAYEVVNERGNEWELVYPEAVHKYKIIPEHRITRTFYAAPVRTKDLTDDEIMKINVDTASIVPTCDRQFHFARAVIAADREKNRG